VAVNGGFFVFNPNTQAPTTELNVNFRLLDDCTRLLGGGEFTPAQITSNQNDFSTVNTDGNNVGVLRLSSDASRTLTGLAGGETGRFLYLINVGSFDIVLANQSGSSVAANRVITGTGANLTIQADDITFLYYDSTTARWRVVSFSDALWG